MNHKIWPFMLNMLTKPSKLLNLENFIITFGWEGHGTKTLSKVPVLFGILKFFNTSEKQLSQPVTFFKSLINFGVAFK